ncbi:MAG: hypothetical protein AAGF76_02350, partial [Pseudomonadota bacterium]
LPIGCEMPFQIIFDRALTNDDLQLCAGTLTQQSMTASVAASALYVENDTGSAGTVIEPFAAQPGTLAKLALSWRDAQDAMARAQSCALTHASCDGAGFASRRAEDALASRVAAAFCELDGALGVLNAEAKSLVSAESFAAQVASMGSFRWPVEPWVGLRLARTPTDAVAGTTNARAFLGYELAVPVEPGEGPAEALTRLAACTSYLLERGPVLADRQTLSLGPGMLLRVEVQHGRPDIYFLNREAA